VSDATGADGARPLVLLAEDDEDVRELAMLALRRTGAEIVAVADGEAAVRAAAERPPRVAVLDVSMPFLDGYEVTRRLRADPATAATRIMLLTARVAEDDRSRATEAGADTRLDKPFSPAELARRVTELLEGA
jgi:DNA-binding response OmpR family regulator